MRDPNRIPGVLNMIKAYWTQYPDLRLCQVLSNIAIENGWNSNDLYYLEDDELIKMIGKQIKKEGMI